MVVKKIQLYATPNPAGLLPAVPTRRESTSRLEAVNNHHHHNNYHYHQPHSHPQHHHHSPQHHPLINRSNSHVTSVESVRSSTPSNYLGLPTDVGAHRLRRNSTHSMHSASPAAMLPPPFPSSSGNFLDPNCRRRLPMAPGTVGRLSPMTIRRASSPRMLPTPPPNSSNPGEKLYPKPRETSRDSFKGLF